MEFGYRAVEGSGSWDCQEGYGGHEEEGCQGVVDQEAYGDGYQ